jgi:ABC-2 type transport system permease protein
VTGLVSLYVQQFKTTLAAMVQYRASLLIWMIGHILEPVVYLIVWSTVANTGGGSVGEYSTADFAAYYIVFMLVNHATYTWIMYEYEYRVREGALSAALLRPVHPIHADIADNVSSKLITLPIMLAAAVLLGILFHPAGNTPLWAAVLFAPVLFAAFLLRFLLEWTLALVAFWTTRVGAVNQTYFVLILFLSGQIAPLSLFPAPVRVAADILPFRWMIGFPVELILGKVSPSDAATGFLAQAVWIILGYFLLRAVWRAGVRVYSAVGA